MADPSSTLVLEAVDLHASYGPVPAVRGLTLRVAQGEAVALLGRNGAGKSSTLRCLAGSLPPTQGTIRLLDRDVTHLPAERRAAMGVALAPEGRGIFPQFSVRENLAMGAYHRRLGKGMLDGEIERVTERFPRLRERLDQRGGSLSGGEQQMLAVARGLMSAPKLLMIDEPSLGLAPIIIDELYGLLGELKNESLTLIVVEQYVELALGFADRAYVLEKGRIVLDGAGTELARSQHLVDAYLSADPDRVREDAPAP